MFRTAFSRQKKLISTLLVGGMFLFGTVHAGIFFSTEEDGTYADIFKIDSDESSTTSVNLIFGNNSNYLQYDTSLSKFTLSDDLTVTGIISATSADFNDGQLVNARIENLSSDTCSGGLEGKLYYDTDTDNGYICNGTDWVQIDGGGGGGTLDTAYDFGGAGVGRTITVDTGAVALSGIGTVLELGNGTANDITLSFNDGAARTLTWDDTNTRFVINSPVRIEGNQAIEGGIYIATDQEATDADGTLNLGLNASTWETLTFDATTDDRFELSDDLHVTGILSADGINLYDGQLTNVRVENLSSDTCTALLRGKIYYDTDDNHPYVCDGTTWVQLDSSGGGGTLDASYDYGGAGVGRTITVDTGAVALSGIGTVLELGNGTANDVTLSFNDGAARTIGWDDTNSRFLVNSAFRVNANQSVEGSLYVAKDQEAADTEGTLNLGRNGGVWETLFFDAATDDRFELSDDLDVDGVLSATSADFNDGQIVNARIENLASAPTCDAARTGKIYHNTADNNSYVCNGVDYDQINHVESTLSRMVTLVPEYSGAVMTGDGLTNRGIMTSDFCSNTVGDITNIGLEACAESGDIHNYYTWEQSGPVTSDYDIMVRWRVPGNFLGWATTDPIKIYGRYPSATTNEVRVYVYDTVGVLENDPTGTQVAGTSWTNTTIESSFGGTYTPGEYITIKIHMIAAVGEHVHVGEISLDYLISN